MILSWKRFRANGLISKCKDLARGLFLRKGLETIPKYGSDPE